MTTGITTPTMTIDPPTPRQTRLLATMLVAVVLAACLAATNALAASHDDSRESRIMKTNAKTTLEHYGYLADGREVVQATLKNANGIEADIISYGGIITRLLTPDAGGRFADIVLGLDSLEEYLAGNAYFGALIGRYGNRIARGQFTLDGVGYQLDINDGVNHLHGGSVGFDKLLWDMRPFVEEHSAGVELSLVSPDGDMGYPGRLNVQVVYELTDDDELDIRFSATTDKPTIVNLTGHSYFNLAGSGNILEHRLQIPAQWYTPVGPGLIPTGELREVAGTPFDFRQAKAIGKDIGADDPQLELGLGYDHNFVLKQEASDELILAARVTDPVSGRVLEVWSVEPGVQFYSGNFLDGGLEGNDIVHNYRTGFCLEPQHFPDSPNEPDFPSTVLRPAETYATRIVYRFGNE